ncbi:MAG: hypothetical protein NC131_20435 [Roseburia sp.]|nr:hypothetical protein [Roseburia sp.]
MSKYVIRNSVTDDVVVINITEKLHVRNFLSERVATTSLFEMVEQNRVCLKKPVAKLVIRDNYDGEERPMCAGMFVGNLDDADLLVKYINDMHMPEYVVSRQSVDYATED